MRCRSRVLVAALALAACDPTSTPPPAVDAGRDAPRSMRDAGQDAGPVPRVDLCDPTAPPLGAYPAPDGFPVAHGPGLGTVDTAVHPLNVNCSFLDGGPMDTTDHHNLGVMFDGYLMLPWAPEYGRGGFTFFDVSDPCAPTIAGEGFSTTMRETHAIGIARWGGETFAVVDQMTRPGPRGGIQFWDISDPTAPVAIAMSHRARHGDLSLRERG